jgi:hypothetical protein
VSSMSGGSSTRNESDRVNKIERLGPTDLKVHPLNARLYGETDWSQEDDKELLASIGTHGILEPIVYARLSFDGESYANYIVSGHRRFAAATKQGQKTFPVRCWGIETGLRSNDLLRVEGYLIESNRQRVKTPEQKTREFTELKRIESALAKERQKQGKANLPEGSKGQARDKAAAKVGMKPRTAEKLEKVVKAADEGNPVARAALDEVNAGKKSVSAAAQAVATPPVEVQPKARSNGFKWSGNDNYKTPDFLYEALDKEFGITLDPCPLNPEPDVDGLELDWTDETVFCNPPWSDITPWVKKALDSDCLTVFVLPARTDTEWYHTLARRHADLRLFRKRVNFIREGGSASPTDGTLVAIVNRAPKKVVSESAPKLAAQSGDK